jgi:hypothetical protein
MSKTYKFISHVEYNHLVEVADILTVRRGTTPPAPASGSLLHATQPRRLCLLMPCSVHRFQLTGQPRFRRT